MKSFWLRTTSTVLLLAAFGGSIFLEFPRNYALFAVIALMLSIFATLELCNLLAAAGRKTYPAFAVISVGGIVVASLLKQWSYGPLIALFAVLFITSQSWLLLLMAKGSKETLDKVFYSLGVVALLALPFFMLISLYLIGRGPILLLFMVLVTKAGDIGAYVVGSLTNKFMPGGNHKMIPSISPGKSWEGAVGGLLLSVIVSLTLGPWAMYGSNFKTLILTPENLGYSTLVLIATGLVLFLGGFIGDLAESSLKRVCGVKDSGKTLPGIGGVLDLLDSLLLNATIFSLFIVVQWFFSHR